MTKNKEKIIDVITKILAKADKSRNPSHEEAEAAILMAQKLMAKHGIESHEVEAYSADDEEIITQDIRKSTNQELPSIFLASIIADNFKVKYYTAVIRRGLFNKRKSTIRFFGKKAEVEVASKIFSHAYDAMEREYERFVVNVVMSGETFDNPLKTIKHNFRLGFCVGLKEKLAEQVKVECMELMVRPDAKVEEAFNKLGTRNKKNHGVHRYDSEAQAHGYARGKNYNYTSGELK